MSSAALESTSIEVGLVAYGHRSQFNFNNKNVILGGGFVASEWFKAQGRRNPPHPYADAEKVFKPRQLETTIGPWIEFLKSVEGHGQTPTYYAVNQALQLLRETGRGPSQIIVLTDGDLHHARRA